MQRWQLETETQIVACDNSDVASMTEEQRMMLETLKQEATSFVLNMPNEESKK